MKIIIFKDIVLIITILLFSVNMAFAGFMDDIFNAIGKGIKQEIQQGTGQGTTRQSGATNQGQAQNEQRGTAFYNKGMKLYDSGKYREAIVELKQAVSIAKSYNNSFGEMNCLLLIGLSYFGLNDYSNAIDYYKEVLQIAKQTRDNVRERTAISSLSLCYRSLNDYSSALNYDEQELKFVRQNESKEEEIKVLDKLFRDSLSMGDAIKSISYLEEGLVASRALGNKKLEMEHLGQLGSLNNARGSLSKAKYNLNKALELSIELNDTSNKIGYMEGLGEVYSQIGDYSKALKLLKQSLNLQPETHNELEEMLAFHALAHIYDALGEYSESVKYYEQTHKLIQKMNKFKFNEDYGSEAIALLLSGNKTKAEEEIILSNAPMYKALYYTLTDRPSLAVLKLPKDELLSYPKELFVTQSKGNLFGLYTVMGLAYEKLGDSPTAKFCYKMAVDIEEKLRDELQEEDRHYFFGAMDYPPLDRLTPYEGLIRVSSPEDAFVYSEDVKVRVLLEQIAGKYEKSSFKIPADIKSRDIELNNSLADLLREQEMALKANDKEHIVKYEKKIVELRDQRDKLVDSLYKEYPQFAAVKYPRPLKLSEIKLNSDEALIEYAVTDTQTRAWLIMNNRVVKTLSVHISRKELEKLVDAYRTDLTKPPKSGSLQGSNFNAELGNKLYSLLIHDFMPLITDANKIIIVPDKKLGLLPFEALVTKFSKKQKQLSDISFLGDDHDIVYSQSASALTLQRALKIDRKPKKALFVLADPIFDNTDPRSKGNEKNIIKKNENTLMQAFEEVSGVKAYRLVKTSLLANKLLETFKDQGTEYLTGIDANENNLRETDLTSYRYLVFATHGILSSMGSGIAEPALLLSQTVDKDENNNGFLTMTKVMGLKLNCDLVALVACEMASGKLVSGEGVMGMGRAFQYAGAESVIASLWSVSEDASVKLIDRYFNYLNAGENKATALRKARNDIKQVGYNHPFFWAPFILIGESSHADIIEGNSPKPTSFEKRSNVSSSSIRIPLS